MTDKRSTKELMEAQNRRYELLLEKWEPIIDKETLGPVEKSYDKRRDLAVLLENQNTYNETTLSEDIPSTNTSGVANWDPVLIGMVRRGMPKLIGYDIFGVQPMTAPVGLAFALQARYNTQSGDEALYQETDTTFSGKGTVDNGTDPFSVDGSENPNYGHGISWNTQEAEGLGTGGAADDFNEATFSIGKISVTAGSRGLRSKYTREIEQDMKNVHGLDAQTELSNILSRMIVMEQNREMVARMNMAAKLGAQNTATAGTFDVQADADGRWAQERWSGLRFQMNIESGRIARDTRLGRGNFIVTTFDVAAALAEAGRLLPATSPNPVNNNGLDPNEADSAFAGILDGRFRVYIDTEFVSTGAHEYATVGYKGPDRYDAGIFFCPYVPLEMYTAKGENSFQPRIGFKTRYGVVPNPLASSASTVNSANGTDRDNNYYRIFKITNLF